MTGRRLSDIAGAEMTEQYLAICRSEFQAINDKVTRIEHKLNNGVDDKITRTDKMVEKLDGKIDGVQKMIIGLMLSVLGGAFAVIMAMVFI